MHREGWRWGKCLPPAQFEFTNLTGAKGAAGQGRALKTAPCWKNCGAWRGAEVRTREEATARVWMKGGAGSSGNEETPLMENVILLI